MRRLVVVVLMAGCGGGHDDDGGGGPDAARMPRVTSTIPDDQETGTLPDFPIRARFSERMDPSTINSDTFVVIEGGIPVRGTVTYDEEDQRASFEPEDRLGLLGHYEALITRDVRSTAGLRPFEEHRWTFDVRDGAWRTPLSLEGQPGSADHPVVASDAHGNAMIVWNQYVFDPAPDVFASRSTAGSFAWPVAESLNNSPSGAAGNPDVVIDRDGVATVAFRDPSPTVRPVARRYTPDVGWNDPEPLRDVDGNVVGLRLTVDPRGVVTAVWISGTDVLSNRYTPGSGWNRNATLIDNLDGAPGPLPVIGADASGNVIAVWTQSDGARNNVYWNRATPSGTWGTAELLETNDSASAASVYLAVAPDGRAFALFWLTSPSGGQFYAKLFNGSGWGSETVLAGAVSGRGSLAWAPDATAWFVYESIFDGGPSDIVARRFSASTGWSSPMSIETDEMEDAVEPQLAIDPRSNVLVVWRDGSDVWWNRFRPGVGWGIAATIQHNDLRAAYVPAIGVGGDGEAVVVWELFDSPRTGLYGSAFR